MVPPFSCREQVKGFVVSVKMLRVQAHGLVFSVFEPIKSATQCIPTTFGQETNHTMYGNDAWEEPNHTMHSNEVGGTHTHTKTLCIATKCGQKTNHTMHSNEVGGNKKTKQKTHNA